MLRKGVVRMANYCNNKIAVIGYDKDNKIQKLLSFAHIDRDVADPWYTRDFKTTYDDVLLGCKALFEYIKKQA